MKTIKEKKKKARFWFNHTAFTAAEQPPWAKEPGRPPARPPRGDALGSSSEPPREPLPKPALELGLPAVAVLLQHERAAALR